MYRDAEAQFKSALKHFSTLDMFLYLCKVYVKLDQPNNALQCFKKVGVALGTDVHLVNLEFLFVVVLAYVCMTNMQRKNIYSSGTVVSLASAHAHVEKRASFLKCCKYVY